MVKSKIPPVPRGMGAAGRALWRAVVTEFELDVSEVRLLTEACRCADELERLRAALEAAPTTTTGSTGQTRVHPLFGEVRSHRAQLAALLKQLDIAAEEDAQGGRSVSVKAIGAARARWGQGRVVG